MSRPAGYSDSDSDEYDIGTSVVPQNLKPGPNRKFFSNDDSPTKPEVPLVSSSLNSSVDAPVGTRNGDFKNAESTLKNEIKPVRDVDTLYQKDDALTTEKLIYLSADHGKNVKKSATPEKAVPLSKASPQYRKYNGAVLPFEELRMASMQGNLSVVKEVLNQGVSVDQTLKSGWTTLMFASSCGKSEIVQYLLQKGANANLHKELFTALMAACGSSQQIESNLLDCVDLLIKFGAQVNACERHRMTPLMFASKEGRVTVVAKLLEAGAGVDLQDNKGWSALSWAATKGQGKVVRLLLEKSADVTMVNVHGQRASNIALSAGYAEVADILEKVEKGMLADLDWDAVSSNKKDSTSMVIPGGSILTSCGEVEMILNGLQLKELIPIFHQHKVTVDIFLRLDENDLEKLGITQLGYRKKITEAIREIHKQTWNTSSLPNLSLLPFITIADASAMVLNMNRHVRFLHASFGFLRDQIEANPRILQLSQEVTTVSKLAGQCGDCTTNIHRLLNEIKFFKSHLEKVSNNVEYSRADLLVCQKDTGTWWQRRLLASLMAVTAVTTILYFAKPNLFANLFSVGSPPTSVLVALDT